MIAPRLFRASLSVTLLFGAMLVPVKAATVLELERFLCEVFRECEDDPYCTDLDENDDFQLFVEELLEVTLYRGIPGSRLLMATSTSRTLARPSPSK